MSINSLLGTARLGLLAQQTAMETTSHNIANASVDGYTRQQAELKENYPQYTPWGAVGTGVVVSNVTRTRDTMLDITYRDQTAKSSAFSTRRDLLKEISGVFGEPSDSGLSSTMDQFWNAWADLANAPDSMAAKSVVQQRGAQVASTLNRYSKGLDDVAARARENLGSHVDTLNKLSSQIADINGQIVTAESGGHTAGDLRDERDRLIDQLGAMVPVQVHEHTDGSTTLYVNGATVVDGNNAQRFSVQSSGSSLVLQVGAVTMRTPGGQVGATLDVLNTDIPNAKAELDALANKLVATINTIHQTGWTASGDALGGANWNTSTPPTGSNVDFFDPAGVTAGAIALSDHVATDASYIAAGNVQNGTGNNVVANQLSQLRSDTTTILSHGSSTQTTSFNEFYRDTVTRLGVATNDADTSATVYDTLVKQADTQRQSANGVSTDEELIEMTKHQQAYAAAAKIVTTANDMLQSLLDMVQ